MKRLLTILFVFTLGSTLTLQGAGLRVGTAVVDISPTVKPFQLRSGKSTYVHDPLHVRAVAFENGHKRGNFRKLPFRRLRAMGLPSLQHRRRLLRHGHLESSFFQMRNENLIAQQQRRLPSARRETAATDSLQTGKHRQTKLVRESAPC